MRRIVTAVGLVLLAAAAGAHAGDLDLSPALTESQFAELVDRLGEAISMPVGPAKPLGTVGFEINAGLVWVNADDTAPWWRLSLGGTSATLGGLGGARVGVRKGLPFGIDVGAQAGSVVGEGFWSAELRKALVDGGALTPSVGVRGAWSRLATGPVDLDVFDIGITVSKRFVALVPYASAGVRSVRADAVWGDPIPVSDHVSRTTASITGGVHITLPPIGLRIELRRATATAAVVSAGIHF